MKYTTIQNMRAHSFVAKKIIDKFLYWWRWQKVMPYTKPGDIICDLGCGLRGDGLRKVESKIKLGYGFDFQVDKSLNSSKIKLAESNLNQPLPLESDSLNVAISTAVMEHLVNYRLFITEMHRVLKVGGLAVVTTPSLGADPIINFLAWLNLINPDEASDHTQYFNATQLLTLFKDAGFSTVKVNKFQLGFNQLVVAQK